MEFKAGVKVQTLVAEDIYGYKRFPVGTVGRIGHIDISSHLPCCVIADGKSYWYDGSELKIVGNDMSDECCSDILKVLDKMEEFTVSRPRQKRVHMTIDELQYYIDRIRELVEKVGNTK